MKRWLLLATAAGLGLVVLLIVLLALGAFFLNRAFSPQKVRPVAEQRLSAALGKPVTLGEVGLSFFPSPAVVARDIRVGGSSGEAPSLSITSLRIAPSLGPLLRGQVAVDRVDLTGVNLVVRRDRKGSWILPYAPPEEPARPAGEAGTPVVIRTLRLKEGALRIVDDAPAAGGKAREVAALTDVTGALSYSGGTTEVQELRGKLGQTDIMGRAVLAADGTAFTLQSPSLQGADLPAHMAFLGMAPIEGLSVSGNCPLEVELRIPADDHPVEADGRASVATLRLGTLEVTAVEAPFKLRKNTLTLSPLTFTAYEGKQKGAVTMRLAKSPLAYTVETRLEKFDVNEALSANTTAKEVLEGTATVSGTVSGAGFDAGALKERLRGASDVEVRDGVVRNFPLLARINRALNITEGNEKDTKFQSLTGHFDIGAGKAHSEDLTLAAGELTVLAKGDIRFDMTLDFKGSAVFSPAKSAEIVRSLTDLRRFLNDRGELVLPLTIKGPVSDPSVGIDLTAALKQGAVGEIKDQIRKLFGK